jgi:hypothetical protein
VNADVFVGVERLDFGSVARLDTAREHVRVRNLSERALRLDAIHAVNTVFVADSLGTEERTDSLAMPQTRGILLLPGEATRVPIRFMPRTLGTFTSDLVLTYTLDGLQRSTQAMTQVRGRSVALKIVPPEIDTVVVNVPRVASALCINRGREPITIATVRLVADTSVFVLPNGTPPPQALLENDTLAVVVSVRARSVGALPVARLLAVVETDTGRNDTVSIGVQGVARLREANDVTARFGLRATATEAAPGGRVRVEWLVSKGEIERLRRVNVGGITATFAMNPNVLILAPEERGARRISANTNTPQGVSALVRYAIPPTNWDGVQRVLKSLECIAVAGETDSTGIVLEDVQWRGVQVEGFDNGVFTAKACDAGGKRLVTSAKKTSLELVSPNPSKDALHLAYTVREDSFVRLELLDIQGNVVQTFVAKEQAAGEYSLDAALLNVPSGAYTVRLESAGVTRSRRVQVVR